ncbi:uncharacterized protein LOC119556469 [Drosophila subpulchrella]|uniref:uncharacterized protein LOC119556469 n=1 Tax=Drosophila subpulchrella TaxID=1486046 RepID=UPI0018A1589B|nr:uncharacterized protein LOC119556469 [Drosophila subpulchrella]
MWRYPRLVLRSGKGQTGEGQTLRHTGEPSQLGCRGSGDGAAGADRRADEEASGAGAPGRSASRAPMLPSWRHRKVVLMADLKDPEQPQPNSRIGVPSNPGS